jgi:hypothetical protein
MSNGNILRKGLFPLLLIIVMIAGSCHLQRDYIFKYVDPLEKVFMETAFFPDRDAVADVARGEYASFQFVFRADEPATIREIGVSLDDSSSRVLGKPTWGYVEYVRIGRRALDPATDRLTSVSGYYPDPIVPCKKKMLAANQSQPVWVSVPVPVNARPGIYGGTIRVKARVGKKNIIVSRDFRIHVYPPVVRKTSLWVTNWYGTDFSFMNDGKDVEPYSEKYWRYMRMLARQMADYDQNVVMISPLQLAQYTITDDLKYTIDFSRFVKTVNLFKEEGVIGRIEGGHIGTRESHWSSPFVVMVPVSRQDTIILEKMKIGNDTARTFYRQFFARLMDVLEEHGWKDIYMQHIADEPTEVNATSYIKIADYVKKLIPGIPIVEACHTSKVKNTISIWVPQLDFLDQDYPFYSERQKKGDEIWFYTCLSPKGEYANRFIDLPLIKTRILHWINFRYQVPGYLHWGYNRWRSQDPYGETTRINKESGNILPGGDSWIVYPGKDTIYPSIRLEAMRDGIVDYELLKMLQEKDPDAAADLAHQVVYGFHTYETDVAAFRSIRKKVLELLSEKGHEH